MKKDIFRKVALDKLSSPEQLDLPMEIITPKGWLALLTLGGLVICAIIWGFWGSVPTKVMGQGILIRTGGVFDIVAIKKAGQIKDIYFKPGDVVKKGQVVARIAQSDILVKINAVRDMLNEQKNRYDEVAQFGDREMKLETESMTEQKQNQKNQIKILKNQVALLEDKITTQEKLYAQGLITKQQMLDTKYEKKNLEQKIRKIQNRLKQLDIRKHQLLTQGEKELSALQARINDSERKLKELQYDLNEASKVSSPYTGRVLEVVVAPGDLIHQGSRLMVIELMGDEIKNLEAVVYFPAREGKKIKQGMKAHIAPSTIKQEEYGNIKSMVTYVSEFPATRQQMMKTLKNESLVSELSGRAVPVEVKVVLLPDPGTPSGFKWSSSTGPSIKLNTGTLCSASVVVKQQRPIELVIPLVKKHVLGMEE